MPRAPSGFPTDRPSPQPACAGYRCSVGLRLRRCHDQAQLPGWRRRLTNTLFRGFIGLPLLAAWLLFGARPKPLTPLQALGGAAMIGALVAFQMRR